MKRFVSVAVALMLVSFLVAVPALAAPGGNGRGAGHGHSARAVRVHVKASHKVKASRRMHAAAKVKVKTRVQSKGKVRAFADSTEPVQARNHGQAKKAAAAGSVDASAPVKLTGIANALWHITRNLDRMSAQLAAGQRDSLPGGLLSVFAKFTAWLGGSGSYVAPGAEPTGTVEPTGTIEPTGTVDASGGVAPVAP